MDWSWNAWLLSVAAVVVSGAVASLESTFTRQRGLAMGFANHGGMWGDLLLLPLANAVIVPYLTLGWWMPLGVVLGTLASVLVHQQWYRGSSPGHSPEHMWPSRPHGSWYRDLSVAGWLHVFYLIAALTLLAGFLLHPMPLVTVLMVAAILTIHVPLGLVQPRWFLTGRLASLRQQPFLVPCLAALWIVAAIKAGH